VQPNFSGSKAGYQWLDPAQTAEDHPRRYQAIELVNVSLGNP